MHVIHSSYMAMKYDWGNENIQVSFLLKRVKEGRQKFVRPQPPSLDKVRLAITLLYPEMLRISRGSQSPAINQFGRGMIWPVRWWWWLWRGRGREER